MEFTTCVYCKKSRIGSEIPAYCSQECAENATILRLEILSIRKGAQQHIGLEAARTQAEKNLGIWGRR